MRAVDTNVLVRLLARDDPRQLVKTTLPQYRQDPKLIPGPQGAGWARPEKEGFCRTASARRSAKGRPSRA